MLVTMGNNNGPRETINEFPCGSAPNEIEINDVTSCTDKQYVTLVDGDGVQSVGVNNNLSFTEDTLCSPKINAGTIESEVIKSSIKTPTETMPVSLASANAINYADGENLNYNPETRTLNSVNASFTNVDTNNLSVENMSFDGLCANTLCADVVNVGTSLNRPKYDDNWVALYCDTSGNNCSLYCMRKGPLIYVCFPAETRSICWGDCFIRCIIDPTLCGLCGFPYWNQKFVPIIGQNLKDGEGFPYDCAPYMIYWQDNHEAFEFTDARGCHVDGVGIGHTGQNWKSPFSSDTIIQLATNVNL